MVKGGSVTCQVSIPILPSLGMENRVNRDIGKIAFIRLTERTYECYLQFRQYFADLRFLRDKIQRDTQSWLLKVV